MSTMCCSSVLPRRPLARLLRTCFRIIAPCWGSSTTRTVQRSRVALETVLPLLPLPRLHVASCLVSAGSPVGPCPGLLPSCVLRPYAHRHRPPATPKRWEGPALWFPARLAGACTSSIRAASRVRAVGVGARLRGLVCGSGWARAGGASYIAAAPAVGLLFFFLHST